MNEDFDKRNRINKYSVNNVVTKTVRTNLEIYDIHSLTEVDLCYDIDEELYKDLLMFTAKSYEDMKKISKNNKEREAVMNDLKVLGSDPEFVDYYDHDEFEEILRECEINDAREEGIKMGKMTTQKEMILKLYHEKGKTIQEIATLFDISQKRIKEIIG